jgi:ribosomal protein S21
MELGWKQCQKAHAFVKHVADVFQPHPTENESKKEEALIQLLEAPYQLEQPMKRFKRTEVQEGISRRTPKESSGYSLITGKILKELLII